MCQTEAGDGRAGGQEPAEERELGPQGRAGEGREGASGSGTGLCPLFPHQEIASPPTPDPSWEPLPGQGGGRAFPTAAGWLLRRVGAGGVEAR